MFDSNITSLRKLEKAFPDEQSCIDYLEKIRWAGEPVSPFDPTSKVYKCKNNYYKCKNTRKLFNVKTGTMYENTKIELRSWFLAIWLVTSEKKGLTSIRLARHIEVTQKTAWFMLQRIRACFGIENYSELDGTVEADEAMVGGKQKNRHKNKRMRGTGGRSTVDKDAVFGMLQRNGKMVALLVPDCEACTLHPIIKKFVKPSATFITDSYIGYQGMDEYCTHYMVKDTSKGYHHDYNPEIHTNGIEGSWKHLKAAVSGMYNHVSRKHLQLYLDEFVYRYNLRKHEDSDKFNWLLFNCNVRTKYIDLIYENNQTDAA